MWAVVFGGEGSKVAVSGEKEVEDELGVESPVARVVEDHYGVDFWGVLGDGFGGGGMLRKGDERPDGGVGAYYVGGGEDVVEAVAIGGGLGWGGEGEERADALTPLRLFCTYHPLLLQLGRIYLSDCPCHWFSPAPQKAYAIART